MDMEIIFLASTIAEVAAFVAGLIGAGVIISGTVIAIIRFMLGLLEKHTRNENIPRRHIDPVRVDFSRYINFGLEFLIAKDILETIFLHSWEQVTQLLILVIIRTIVSFFLMYEVQRIETGSKKK